MWVRVLVLGVLVAGCGSTPVRNYYTLTYPTPEATTKRPANVVVRVREVRVRESYRRAELVHRYDVHEIRYYRSRRWSEPPAKMMTALLREHLRASNVAAQVTSEIGQTPPEYTFEAELEAMEEQIAGPNRYARLAMDLALVRTNDDAVVWRKHFDARKPVGGNTARGTVRALSRIFAAEVGAAVEDLGRYLGDPGGYFPDTEKPVGAQPEAEADTVRPDPESELNDLPGLLRDDTPMPVGFGAIFLPAVAEGDRLPPVAVYRSGEAVLEGEMGHRLVLEPGTYEVRLGSGTESQQVTVKVLVEAGRTTVVKPSWGELDVEVVDTQFVPFRGGYELIRLEDRDAYGVGFGADALSGEATRVWLLRPGLYKIVRAGGTYRDRTDFATVRVSRGRLRRFTLVQDSDTGEFKGAGEVDPVEEREREDSNWSGTAVVGGSVLLNRTNVATEGDEWGVGLALFLDGSLTYEDPDQVWVTRLDLEESQASPNDQAVGDGAGGLNVEGLESIEDRLFAHTIYTYLLVPWFGPYVRLRLDTVLLPKHVDCPANISSGCFERDGDGNPEPVEGRVRVRDGAFSPLVLQEGAGGNFRAVRRRDLELDLRAGLGARQYLSEGLHTIAPDGEVVNEEDDIVEGLEGAVVLLGRITRWVTLSSEFDGLFPFSALEKPRFTWRNQVSLRLSSFASLAYRLNVTGDPSREDEELPVEHDLQLRLSYTLF